MNMTRVSFKGDVDNAKVN